MDENSPCCGTAPAKQPCGCTKSSSSDTMQLASELTPADRWGFFACRISNRFRMDYSLDPGLYALGNPDADAPVIVTANYRLTINHLRKELSGRNLWILVLDTKGINVWCAAGKGTFGTAELINRINATNIASAVNHRTLILPQLGAPGVVAHDVTKATGFGIKYGPISARDLPEYLDNGYKASPAMRTVTFPMWERLILTPMEAIPALKKFPLVILGGMIIMGLQPSGILFKAALFHSLPIIMAGLIALICGTFIMPVLLPLIPFRSFALKGALVGAAALISACLWGRAFFLDSLLLLSATIVFFTAAASFLALNFTGCTTFTNISGVKKEMRIAVPAYLAASGMAAILLIVFKLQEWRVL